MKKLINNPDNVVEEMIEGYVKAFPNHVKQLEHPRALAVAQPTIENKVGIVIGGGSGHEPAFLGYIGLGFADSVAIGNIFASPPPDPIISATLAANKGSGVVYIYGNYAGDIMNFSMAAELVELEHNIQVKSIVVNDDVASASADESHKRRGIAGEFFVTKVAGAAATAGYNLDQVVEVAKKTCENTRSMGVGLSPCYLPQTGKPSFELANDEMEIGLGHHGEPGVAKGKLETADQISEKLVTTILNDMSLAIGSEVAVLVNGLGSTTNMDLFIVFRSVAKILEERNIKIYRSYVGSYSTSLEMGGCSVTLLKLDEELKKFVDAPADCPMFVQH